MIDRLTINEFINRSESALVIDVRSPSEFLHAHFPGAHNVPLFNDEERKVVGTAYKQESREKAIKIGLDFFGPKMKTIVEEVESLIKSLSYNEADEEQSHEIKKEIFIYCWRGGMRSAAIAWLLDLYGFKVTVLSGGYKSYRNYVLALLSLPYRFRVLGGYTGSGKTELLHELKKRGEPVIDLEQIASHKGSAFGSIGLPKQPSQEMFENLLALELSVLNSEDAIWIEDESQRIGLINIPKTFWDTIRNAHVYFLDIPFEERLSHIVSEYGQFEKSILAEAILRISKRLGGLETKNAIQYLEQDDLTECFRILLKYYDKSYFKGLHNRQGLTSMLTTIICSCVDPENANLLPIKRQFA